MNKLLDILFEATNNNNTRSDTSRMLVDVEREYNDFKSRWYHDAIKADSNQEGRRLIYLKLVDSDIDIRNSLLYPQGLAIVRFNEGNYTRRVLTESSPEKSFLLVYTLSGTGVLHYKEREYLLEKNDGFVIDCTNPHFYRCLGTHWSYSLVHFAGPPALGYQRQIETGGTVKFTFSQDSSVVADFKSLFSIYLDKKKSQEIRAAFSLTSMLTQILLQTSNKTKTPQIPDDIQGVRKYINDNYAEKVTLDSLAKLFKMSKYNLAHQYKESYGCPPIDYLLSVRLDRAKDLLRHSDFTMTEICHAVGISSTNHFYYLFKKRCMMSPTQYRNTENMGHYPA